MKVKEWVEEEQGKHFCQCGCGKEITITKKHHYKGIPKYIHGHNKTVTKRTRQVSAWIKQEQGKHFCHCGCGREITIIRQHHCKGIPKYVNGHNRTGATASEETRQKIRKNHAHLSGKNHPMYGKTGEKHWNYGKHRSEEVRRKIGKANRGKHVLSMLSEETKRKMAEAQRGKHLTESTKKKISKAVKGEKHPFFGKHHTEGAKHKISEAHKGAKHCNFGKHLSKETKRKIGDASRGRHHTEEAKKKIRKARSKQKSFPTHHTKPELRFEEICKKYDLHFKYVGDGQLWIGKAKAMNPDFIQADGQKIVVEIMGDYWHSPLLNPKAPVCGNLNYRKKHYKKYGWIPYFVWESDLKRPDAEQFVLNMLNGVGTPK